VEEKRRKIRVGVIFGGRSAEHEVSLNSAKSVIKALNPDKYDISLIGITSEGRWISFGEVAALPEGQTVEPAKLLGDDNKVKTLTPEGEDVSTALVVSPAQALSSGEPFDVVFPVLHGPYGEDGTLQGLLEMANVPYVGAGVLASAVGMDKDVAKQLFKVNGIPIIDYSVIKRKTWEATATNPAERAALLKNIEAEIGYPCFVKPVNMGSSVGVMRAIDTAELIKALDNAARYDRKLMIEKGIKPRELEVAVLGNDDPVASVVGELAHSSEFYDYEAKYKNSEGMSFFIPAQIPVEVSERIRTFAVQAYQILDCAGMTRVDFFMDKDSGELYLNEVNTIPGFTSLSMYPMMWEATGVSYPELVDKLIELALERHADKNRRDLSPA
jgi:D-alanine-D-alanine ligase